MNNNNNNNNNNKKDDLALTEEQKERIRKNRERALEIQRKRKQEQEQEEEGRRNVHHSSHDTKCSPTSSNKSPTAVSEGPGNNSDQNNIKRQRLLCSKEEQSDNDGSTTGNKNGIVPSSSLKEEGRSCVGRKQDDDDKNKHEEKDDDEELVLEDFEMNASDYITRDEAKKMYCLPDGTLNICTIVETKMNPRNRSFQPMKLYSRNEIRQRARKRYGGLYGLIHERKKRQEKRYQNDLHRIKDIFK